MFQLTLGFSRDSAQGVRRGGSAGIGEGGRGVTSVYPPREPPFTFLFQSVNKTCEIGALFVALDALFFVYCRFFLDIVFYLLSEPLGADYDLPNCPSYPRKC